MRPSGPPTDSIPLWTTADGVDRDTGQAVVDLALRAGVAMLATGASAADVTATVLMLTRAYGLTSVHVDVTYTSLTVSYHRGPRADPMTVMRIVPFRSQDFTRLERLRELILSLTRDPLPVDEARVRFDGVVSSPHPYRRWLVTGAGGALAAGAAALVGAGPFIVLISFVTALVVGRVMAWLSSAGIASFFAQSVGAAIPTLVATLVVALQSRGLVFFGDVSPSLLVASGIVLLLSGLSVVGAAEDALEGYYVTAGARAFEVIALTLGIAVGVSTVLSLGARLGFPIAITSQTRVTDELALQVVCAVVISVAFAAMSYARGRVIVAAGVAGALGWLVLALGERLGIGSITVSAIAAATVGFVTRVAAPRLGYSALAVTTAAIVPLLPGRLAYQGISEIVSRPDETGVPSGLTTLAQAFGTGLALAAGVAMGTYFAGLIQAKRTGARPRPAAAASRRTVTRAVDGPRLSDTGEVPAVEPDVEHAAREPAAGSPPADAEPRTPA
ncbi:MAG: threonine/serine exporter family protein [Humibacillus sp.]